MSRRDEELKRLINYAKGHGLKVITVKAKRGEKSDASWALDGTELTVYLHSKMSKTDLIMTLIHELGHHLWFIHEKDRKPDLKFEEAITRADNAYDMRKPLGKKYRKKILSVEIAGTKWWRTIYKDTDIKIPEWKLDMNMEFDLWQYQVYYETGVDTTKEQRKDKHKELLLKWKPNAE